MAIKIVTGKPGSGKSYFALNKVILEGFEFNKKTFEWKEKKENLTIITNVEGLKLPHFTLDKMIEEYADGNYEKFFTCDIQQIITDKFPRVRYIIDECQRLFHSRYYNKDVFFYFQYHRHYGHDIYMIAQVWDSISKHITGLCEYEFRAAPKSLSLFNEFTYGVYSGWDKVGSVRMVSDKKIFALYQSFQNKDVGKEIRPMRKFAVMAILLLVTAFGFGYYWLSALGDHSVVTEAEAAQAVPPGATAPGAAPSSLSDRSAFPSSSSGSVRPGRPGRPSDTVDVPSVQYMLQYASAFLVGDRVHSIQFNGKLYPAEIFPWQYTHLGKGVVQILVPASAVQVASVN